MSSEEPTSSPFTPVPEQTPQEKRERLIREVLDHASSGNLNPFVEAIVSGKLDVDQMDSRGYTAIHLAVWRLDMQSVLTLLDKASCPIDLQSGTGQTPLMLATVKGSLQMIKLFLDRGADIEFKDTLGISPIICAAQSGQLGPFYALLHRGAKIDVKDRNGCDIVHWAAYKNQIQMLHVLKAMGLELESLDTAKMTPLHRAAMSNAIDSIDFLLFNNVASDKIDEKKRTALDIAIENCSEGSAKILASYSVEEEPIHTYFFFWCTLYWIGIYYVYYDYVLPATVMNLFPSLVFNISVLWLLPIYLLNKYYSAEALEPSTENHIEKHFQTSFDKDDYEDLPKADDYCLTCHIKRPNRSKHCRFTKKCISDYDHYCYFLSKPIGKGNHKVFVFGLLLFYQASIFFLYLSWCALHQSTGPFQHISTYIVSIILVYLSLDGLCKVMILLSLLISWYVFWYLFIEIYAISQGLTINEVLNRHRYRYLYTPFVALDGTVKMKFQNPFNKGFVQNWLEFIVN